VNREYHKQFSQHLGRDMELLVFGQGGVPLIVFPTSMGRFFDYEDRGMIATLSPGLECGECQVFCVDSVDGESWYNKRVPPRARVCRHIQYEMYLLNELLGFIRSRNHSPQMLVTGCSFGGYHAANFAFRHPDLVSHCVVMGAAFDIHQFLDGYYDDNCYFNCPPDYLVNLADDWYLSRFRQMRIVLGTGVEDICLNENRRLSGILHDKSVPHWLDVWGNHTGHDWPWWQRMAAKYFLSNS
jgi:esterase/lipase superfamily enzyme